MPTKSIYIICWFNIKYHATFFILNDCRFYLVSVLPMTQHNYERIDNHSHSGIDGILLKGNDSNILSLKCVCCRFLCEGRAVYMFTWVQEPLESRRDPLDHLELELEDGTEIWISWKSRKHSQLLNHVSSPAFFFSQTGSYSVDQTSFIYLFLILCFYLF